LTFFSLNNKVSYSILFLQELLFHIFSACFCLCKLFFIIFLLSLDNSSTKSIKCVFLWYSRLSKGYRCYSSKTKRYYMYANVTCFEPTPSIPPSIHDIYFVLHVPLVESFIPFALTPKISYWIHKNFHHHFLLPINTRIKLLIQCSRWVFFVKSFLIITQYHDS